MNREREWNRRTFLAASALFPALARGAERPRVLPGLDRVVEQKGAPLMGKRVGLLVHAASLTADGRHAIDALTGSGVKLVRLFGAWIPRPRRRGREGR